MPRTKSRARRRRARAEAEQARIANQIETLWDRIRQAQTTVGRIAANVELIQLLKLLADSDHRVWSFFPDEFFGQVGENPNVNSPRPCGPKPTVPGTDVRVAREDVGVMKALTDPQVVRAV